MDLAFTLFASCIKIEFGCCIANVYIHDRTDESLAPHDADLVAFSEWAAFSAENLPTNMGPVSIEKICSLICQNLANLGILIAPNTSREETRMRHSESGFCTRGYLAGSPLWRLVIGFGAKGAGDDPKLQMFNREVE